MMLILGLFTAYLLGSVPFALILVRLVAGVDVREIGSGNVGATNAARAFGKRGRIPMFALIYVLDCAKGLLPTLLGPSLFGLTGSQTPPHSSRFIVGLFGLFLIHGCVVQDVCVV